MRYRKKPVVIEAFQIQPNHWSNAPSWPEWFYQATQKPGDQPGAAFMGVGHNGIGTVEIFTLEGVHTAKVGDWIIRGVRGELYPVKPDIFEMTYEAVRECTV